MTTEAGFVVITISKNGAEISKMRLKPGQAETHKALRYCQTHLDWLLDMRHRPGGPNPLTPQTPPSLQSIPFSEI